MDSPNLSTIVIIVMRYGDSILLSERDGEWNAILEKFDKDLNGSLKDTVTRAVKNIAGANELPELKLIETFIRRNNCDLSIIYAFSLGCTKKYEIDGYTWVDEEAVMDMKFGMDVEVIMKRLGLK